MKKIIPTTLMLVLSLTACSPKTQIWGDTSELSLNIAQVKTLQNQSHISLEGYIVKQLNDDHYLLKDNASDEIQVKIKDRVWNGISLTPNDKVRIDGKLHKGIFTHWIEVDWLEKSHKDKN